MRSRFWVILLASLSLVAALAADRRAEAGPDGDVAASRLGVGTRVVPAVPADAATAIRLTGDVSDSAWSAAPVIDGFVQREPHEGKAPSFRTEARILYDRSALYVSVRAYDPDPSQIVGLLTRRDTDSPSDWIGVIVDSYHDRRTAYEFNVNAAGVKTDKYRYNDTRDDIGWDAVWDAKTTRDAQGWTAQFRIPFSQLRFDPARTNTFGLAIVRRIGRLNETNTWPLLPRSAPGYVSSLGELTGLALKGSQKRLELVPYTVGQLETQPVEGGNPFTRARTGHAAVGADAKFAVTPALTVTATLNPDFGQVEADPAVVNLSAFETYFNERRPFFVEGSGIFRFDIDCNDGECRGLFYSRRIGRTPRGEPDVPAGGFSSVPAQTTILGAAKLTGRVGKFSVGGLTAVTSEERAQLFDGARTTSSVAEPLTSYAVGRATREFANQSSIGFMMTATNRRLAPDVSFLPNDAYTGGMDWDWRLGKGKYSLAGFWAGSTVRGSAAAIDGLQTSMVHAFQRPRAEGLREDATRTSLNGASAQLAFSKIAGKRLMFNSVAWFKTPGFDINDLGFQQRADERGMANWLQVRRDKPTRLFRSMRLNFNQWALYNFDGDRLDLGGNVNGNLRTSGNYLIGGGVNVAAAGFDDRSTRGGPGARTTRWLFFWHSFETDDRKPVQFMHSIQGGRDAHDSSRWTFEPTIRVRSSSALSVTGGLEISRNVNDSQWVEKVSTATDHFVFGRLDQTTVALTVRVNYTITPRLTIQLYGQPFVSAGGYSRFKQLVDGRASRYQDRYASFDYAGNRDFDYRSFRATNVLRWEYRPGSTLFVVWQQGREETIDRGDFRFSRDFRDVFRVPGRNVLLLKLAHWLNF